MLRDRRFLALIDSSVDLTGSGVESADFEAAVFEST